MRNILLPIAGAACLWSGIAAADHFVGACECGKADPQHFLPAGDRADHTLGVEALKCAWSKPLDINGDKAKESVATEIIEISGKRFHGNGVHEIAFQSGDKVALPYHGVGIARNDQEASNKGSFTFAEGTGKLKGIKGTGTFSCKSIGDSTNCAVEGDYQLPR